MARVDLDLIQQLRDKTGLGMMDCKKALQESDGDIEKAIEILRKKGAAVAEKRSGRITGAGLVHAYIHPGSQVGVLIEIDCETDFVARTDDVKQLAQDIAMHIAAFRPLYLSPDKVDPKFLEHEKEIYREQMKDSGKPAEVVEKIIEGKLKKLYSEVCLLNQAFVKNDQMTVDEKIKEIIGKVGENIKIKQFARFEVGA